jgi:beta-glucuronidase
VLREHDRIFRDRDWVAGLIFFCYNDYRTHVGDKGRGVMKQRVHGVVDLYGARKPSYEVLRRESSPLETMTLSGTPERLEVAIKARASVPAYTMRGYTLRAVAFGHGNIPLERVERKLPDIKPGESITSTLTFIEKAQRIQVDILRPTGFSVLTERL